MNAIAIANNGLVRFLSILDTVISLARGLFCCQICAELLPAPRAGHLSLGQGRSISLGVYPYPPGLLPVVSLYVAELLLPASCQNLHMQRLNFPLAHSATPAARTIRESPSSDS